MRGEKLRKKCGSEREELAQLFIISGTVGASPLDSAHAHTPHPCALGHSTSVPTHSPRSGPVSTYVRACRCTCTYVCVRAFELLLPTSTCAAAHGSPCSGGGGGPCCRCRTGTRSRRPASCLGAAAGGRARGVCEAAPGAARGAGRGARSEARVSRGGARCGARREGRNGGGGSRWAARKTPLAGQHLRAARAHAARLQPRLSTGISGQRAGVQPTSDNAGLRAVRPVHARGGARCRSGPLRKKAPPTSRAACATAEPATHRSLEGHVNPTSAGRPLVRREGT